MATPTRPRPSLRPRSAGARPRADRRAAAPSSSRLPWLIAAMVVVVGLAALVAVMGSGGGGTSTGVEQAVVTATGAPLPDADGSGLLDPATDSGVGKTIPTIAGSTPTGTPITYAPNGKPTVYLFVAHWCPHCQAEVPRIVDWIAKGELSDTSVVWRTVSTAVDKTRGNYPPSAWFTKVRWDYPVLVDSSGNEAAAAFGLQSFPYMVFVDGNGVVKQRATGELTLAEFQRAIAAIGA